MRLIRIALIISLWAWVVSWEQANAATTPRIHALYTEANEWEQLEADIHALSKNDKHTLATDLAALPKSQQFPTVRAARRVLHRAGIFTPKEVRGVVRPLAIAGLVIGGGFLAGVIYDAKIHWMHTRKRSKRPNDWTS